MFNSDTESAMVVVPGAHLALCAIVTTGMGDGLYPVEVRLTELGQVAEVRVRFLEDDGRQPGMPTEQQATAQRKRDRARVLAADRANVKKYGKRKN